MIHIKCSEIPTANLNARRYSSVKIVCCSSELIFTSLYAGSSIQNQDDISSRISTFLL